MRNTPMTHIIILRNGETLTGQVTTREFSIKTSYAELTFKKSEIVHIHFENPPQFTQDEMLLLASDVLSGKAVPGCEFRVAS